MTSCVTSRVTVTLPEVTAQPSSPGWRQTQHSQNRSTFKRKKAQNTENQRESDLQAGAPQQRGTTILSHFPSSESTSTPSLGTALPALGSGLPTLPELGKAAALREGAATSRALWNTALSARVVLNSASHGPGDPALADLPQGGHSSQHLQRSLTCSMMLIPGASAECWYQQQDRAVQPPGETLSKQQQEAWGNHHYVRAQEGKQTQLIILQKIITLLIFL